MFKNILESVDGLSLWAIVSMLIFFILFIFLFVRIITYDKRYMKYMSSLPLEEETTNIINKGVNNGNS
jgi:cytochrome c oxidase cbb3-type subunit IV